MGITFKDVRSQLSGTETDACIVDADADYVTFAVRVSRATLRANHHFLAAASEASVGDSVGPLVFRGVPIRRKALRKMLFGGLVGLVPVLAGLYYMARAPGVEVQGVTLVTKVLAPGDPLRLISHQRRTGVCATTVDHSVLDDNNADVWRERRSGIVTKISESFTAFPIEVPIPRLPAGRYHFNWIMKAECGALDTEFLSGPTLDFEVKSAVAAADAGLPATLRPTVR